VFVEQSWFFELTSEGYYVRLCFLELEEERIPDSESKQRCMIRFDIGPIDLWDWFSFSCVPTTPVVISDVIRGSET
jgi:hypothetical protein